MRRYTGSEVKLALTAMEAAGLNNYGRKVTPDLCKVFSSAIANRQAPVDHIVGAAEWFVARGKSFPTPAEFVERMFAVRDELQPPRKIVALPDPEWREFLETCRRERRPGSVQWAKERADAEAKRARAALRGGNAPQGIGTPPAPSAAPLPPSWLAEGQVSAGRFRAGDVLPGGAVVTSVQEVEVGGRAVLWVDATHPDGSFQGFDADDPPGRWVGWTRPAPVPGFRRAADLVDGWPAE